MKLDKITHTSMDRGEPTKRDIISINGMCFYRSSGVNSSAGGTWFPFLGIEQEGRGIFGRGWYRKNAFQHYLPDEVAAKIESTIYADEILKRFSSVPALLISSLLSGGVWDTDGGKTLKVYLEQAYPDFYATWPKLIVAEQGQEFNRDEIEKVNNWLVKKAKVVDQNDLYNTFISDLTELKVPEDLLDTPVTYLTEYRPVGKHGKHYTGDDLSQSVRLEPIVVGFHALGKHGKPYSGDDLFQSVRLEPITVGPERGFDFEW